ncbi:MAG: hypothetical protein ACYTKC_02970 [Planctomycetota bacterium]
MPRFIDNTRRSAIRTGIQTWSLVRVIDVVTVPSISSGGSPVCSRGFSRNAKPAFRSKVMW